MGIENMRRWPMYVMFAVCVLLTLSLFNSWSWENELRNRISEITLQLTECSKLQKSFMEESISLIEQKEARESKIRDLEEKKGQIDGDLKNYKEKAAKSEMQVNRTLVDVQLCKTELESLKGLHMSSSATLETLRLEKETLTTQLDERKLRIGELEKEVERLKSALTTKSASNPPAPSKATPAAAAAPPKMSPSLNVHQPINEPVLENNDAKEELEDTNAVNDGSDFDAQLQ